MFPAIASLVFAAGILGLFYLDRNHRPRMSFALWIAGAWLFLNSSRPLSMWLGISSNFGGVDATQAYLDGSPIDRAVYSLLVVAALAVLVTRRNKVGVLLRENAPVILYFLFCLVSIFWSDYSMVAFKRWIKSVGDLEIVLIILTEADPLSSLSRLMTRLGFLLFPLSVLFIKYYPALGRLITLSWTSEATGVSTQKNDLGLVCMMYGVAFVWAFLSTYGDKGQPNRLHRLVAYGTIVGMIIWLLVQCGSTTSITGFVAASGVMWFTGRPSRKPAMVHLMVFGVLCLVVVALFFDPGGGLVGALGKSTTLTGRTEIWNLVLSLRTNPWIGTGYESFWLGPRLVFMRTAMPNFPVNEAHNGYLEVYLNLGWAGICLIAVLLATGYRRIISAIRQDPPKGSLFLGFLLCTLFNSFTEASFRLMTVSWIFFLLVIMGSSRVVSLAKNRDRAREKLKAGKTRERMAFASKGAVWSLGEGKR